MNVGEKAIDLFSFGHLVLGFLLFLFSYLLLEKIGFPWDIAKFISLDFVIFFSLIWEFFENTTKIGMAIRPIKHKDTLRNSLSDIIFGIIGSLFAFFIIP